MSIGKLNGLFHRSPEPRCPRSCLPRLGHASLHLGDQPLAHRAEDSARSSLNGVVPIDLPPPTDREMGQYLETRIAFEELLARYPRYELRQPMRRAYSSNVRGLSNLPLALDPAA